MIQYQVYPGGKKGIVTFSYDDGKPQDAELIAMFNTYGVKGTFHLNGKNYLTATEEEKTRLRGIYAGHEIACHTLNHGYPTKMPVPSVVNEVMEDRKILESIAGYPVVGMSYPYGDYNESVMSAMQTCGIVYSRTVDNTPSFRLPENFMAWHPTSHHRNALPLCERFIKALEGKRHNPLLYIWGHSYEFKTQEHWDQMEQILQLVARNDGIWYATNIEIYNYVSAQNRLQISADEKMFHNPSAVDVWVERNKEEIIRIPAGETVTD